MPVWKRGKGWCRRCCQRLNLISDEMYTSGKSIISMDDSNAFNSISHKVTLEMIYQKVQAIYLLALIVHGTSSYTVLEDDMVPVEESVVQGCRLACSMFNIALSWMVEN